MTILVDIFDTLDLQGVLYFRTNFTQPWAVEVPSLGQATRFHFITQGSSYFKFPSGQIIHAHDGDIVLIPAGRSHMMSCEEITKAPSLETVLATTGYQAGTILSYGGDLNPEASTKIVCGHFEFRGDADHPILNALPEAIIIQKSQRIANPPLDKILGMVIESVMSGHFGSEATFKRLSEIVFIEIICEAAKSDVALGTVLEAFTDVHIGQSLDLIHKNIQDQWTVGSLAARVGMSRSRFAERFKSMMGVGPMTYLANWRLQKAMTLLQKTPLSIKLVAAEIGYQSPAAFTRAFSQKFGLNPTDFRKSSTNSNNSS